MSIGYVCLFSWLTIRSGDILEKYKERLPSKTILIDWDTMDEEEGAENTESSHVDSSHSINKGTKTQSLGPAPIKGLYITSQVGRQPIKRRSDGLMPFDAYRRNFDLQAAEKPVIALGIAELGLSTAAMESAIRSMPPEVSLIMSPYTKDMTKWRQAARDNGHEIWLTLPMEGVRYPYDDPGPHALLINAPTVENQQKLAWIMGRADGYVGFVTSKEPLFMQSLTDVRPVLSNIYRRGLAFIDMSEKPGPIPETMAYGMRAPYGNIDIVIDKTIREDTILDSLDRLEKLATKNGVASGVFHPYPVSYRAVIDWVKTLEERGFIVAPLSAIAVKIAGNSVEGDSRSDNEPTEATHSQEDEEDDTDHDQPEHHGGHH